MTSNDDVWFFHDTYGCGQVYNIPVTLNEWADQWPNVIFFYWED